MDRRRPVFPNRDCQHRRRMSAVTRLRLFAPVAALLAAAAIVRARRNPAQRAPLRLRRSRPRNQGDAGRRHRQPRHAGGARRRGAVEGEDRQRARLRRMPRRRQDQHERRRRALPGVRTEAQPAGQPRPAHQHLPRRAPGGEASRLREQGSAGALHLHRHAIARRADRAAQTIRGSRRSAKPAARPTSAARASSICPARNATTTTGARSSPATSSRRRIRTAIRSTVWNGRASARCSGGCATA